MDVTQEVNLAIVELWRQTFEEGTDVLLPLIYPKIKKSGILFIGLNPSFNARGIRNLINGTELESIDIDKFYHYRNIDNYNLETAQKIVKLSRDNYPYFRKFQVIAQHIKTDWEHIDLYFYPETTQRNIRGMINNNNPANFWVEQLKLSKKLIIEAEPIIIVVANAYASQIFQIEFDAKPNEEKICYEIKLNNKTLPVFLGGMLTGQRALDNYSFERLKWVISKLLKASKDE